MLHPAFERWTERGEKWKQLVAQNVPWMILGFVSCGTGSLGVLALSPQAHWNNTHFSTMFVYLSPSNHSLFPCIVNILALCCLFVCFFLTSVISCPLFSPDKISKLTIISNYLWPNNVEVCDSQTLHLCLWHQSLFPPGPTLWSHGI